MYKFLSSDSGEEANYEIEAPAMQGDLFTGTKQTKIEQLAEEIEKLIRDRYFQTDGEVVLHCLTQGILPSRVAADVYKKLRDAGVIAAAHGNRPRASYDAINNPRPLGFTR